MIVLVLRIASDQVVVLQNVASTFDLVGKEANEYSGGLLPFWLVIFIAYSIISIIISHY
jgi:hypothetical protein